MKVHNPNKLPTAPINDLLPTQGELKDLTEANYNKLKSNIERRGFIDPVSVWEDDKGIKHLLNGHQRQRVLSKEGWTKPIPYFNIPANNLQEAAAIVLELTSQYGTVTQEGLDSMIAEYELPEAEIYEATHFDALTVYEDAPEPEIEEDEAPEVSSEPPVSELGKVYQLGKHRVMCGSATDLGDISELIDGKDISFVFTDPPYGMNAVSKSGVLSANYDGDIMGDDDITVAVDAFKVVNEILEDVTQVWWGANYYSETLPSSECWIVWNKNNGGSDQTDAELAWCNARSVVRMFTQASEKVNRVHPTQKPVELATWAFGKFKAGETVLDLFLGSGSTLIACEQTDRVCYGMELDPKYTDVIRKRYAKFIQPDNELPENWQELTPEIAR